MDQSNNLISQWADAHVFYNMYLHKPAKNAPEIEKEELKDYFVEFHEFDEECRFIGCSHLNEPGCAVKEALKEHKISKIRYENYTLLYEELKNQRRY